MPLSIFIDALPFSEIKSNYNDWFDNIEIVKLIPNVGYSSSLHWQLYCDVYPDQNGYFVDWVYEREKRKSVKFLSKLLTPLDYLANSGVLARKILDRYVYKKNMFANLPFKFRPHFTEKGNYLFWKKENYSKQNIFTNYEVLSQDELKIPFKELNNIIYNIIKSKGKNIFIDYGFCDEEGHILGRGTEYSAKIKEYMDELKKIINFYLSLFPNEEVLIVSDHGMSNIVSRIDIDLESQFGKESKNSYIAYKDSAIMIIYSEDEELLLNISEHLNRIEYGHLLTDQERLYYGVTSSKFGQLIYILKEGNVFKENWFGKSLRKNKPSAPGMHGFWPEKKAEDQMATIITINGKKTYAKQVEMSYKEAYKYILFVMQGEK